MKLSLLAYCIIAWSVSCGRIGQGSPDLRLVSVIDGGKNTTSGRLEFLLNSTWHSTCFIQYELQEADASCEALGYLYAKTFGSVSSLSLPPGSPGQPTVKLSCSFSSIETCTTEVIACNHTQEVGLTCTNEVTPMRVVSAGGQQIASSPVGVVELFINGVWGTVCSSNFGFVEADAACRQLGFEGADAYSSVSKLQYKEISSAVPVWLTGISCGRLFQLLRRSGHTLDNIRLCPHTDLRQTICNHSTDAIVSCITPGALRLVVPNRGTNNIRQSGRLEIYWNGIWGRVCSRHLTELTALVACRQLGFMSVDCYGSLSDLGIELDNSAIPRPVIISDVQCLNQPSSLLQCSYTNGSSDCTLNADDVALSCYAGTTETTTSSCSLDGENGGARLTLPITLVCVAVVVTIIIIIFIGLQLYCRRSTNFCSKYGRAPVRHEETSTASVSTVTEITAPSVSRTTRPSQGRHDYLRRNPNRARHHRLRRNDAHQQQPARVPSRHLHNWRYIHTNFRSREQESNSISVSENCASESFFISDFGHRTHTDGTTASNSTETTVKLEDVPAKSILQQVPPPSYENATSYPPAYFTEKQDEAPPYSKSISSSVFSRSFT